MLSQHGDLEILDLRGSAQLTDRGLARIAQLAPGLRELRLMNCALVSDVGLAHVGRISTLRHLDLVNCTRITDAGMGKLGGLVELRELLLGGCLNIGDAGLSQIARLSE